jgi:DNA-directed RNA polymerase subunit L
MELEKLRATENVLEFNIAGENHTFLNVLRQILSEEMSEVQFAAYKTIQYENPKFYVRVEPKENPIDIISTASKRISEMCNELITQIEKLKI